MQCFLYFYSTLYIKSSLYLLNYCIIYKLQNRFFFSFLIFNPVCFDWMTLFILQNIDCLVLTLWASQQHTEKLIDSINMNMYQTAGSISVHILLVQDPNEHMSHLYWFLFFKKWSCSFSVFNIKPNSVWNTGWIFYHLFTQRNKDTRQSHVQAPHKYMPKCFFYEFTSKCIKIPFSIIWKCIFLNYSSQGIEAPRSFKFFISAQLQTVDLVKGTQFWGVGIAAGRSWQDFQSRGTSRFFITAKQRNKSRSIKIRNKRAEWLAVSEITTEICHKRAQGTQICLEMQKTQLQVIQYSSQGTVDGPDNMQISKTSP